MNYDVDASLVPAGERVLAAVSGGADSLALLWWLCSLGRDVVVGHVHHDLHELRSGDCDLDAAFVEKVGQRVNVPVHVLKVDLPRKSGHVNEAVARAARYASLQELAVSEDCTRIVTAHTATDGLETALINLMRGGVLGLAGINPYRALEDGVSLVRPFWRLPRSATREMLRAAGWEWREDASNRDPVFRRNRVRHELLPLLASISEREIDALALQHAQNSLILRDEFAWLDQLSREALEVVTKKREVGLLALDGLGVREFPIALQRRVLRIAGREIGGSQLQVSFTAVESVREWVSSDKKRKVWTWPGDLRVEWTGSFAGNRIRFWRVSS